MLGGATALDGVRSADVQEMMEDRTGSHVPGGAYNKLHPGESSFGIKGIIPLQPLLLAGQGPSFAVRS